MDFEVIGERRFSSVCERRREWEREVRYQSVDSVTVIR